MRKEERLRKLKECFLNNSNIKLLVDGAKYNMNTLWDERTINRFVDLYWYNDSVKKYDLRSKNSVTFDLHWCCYHGYGSEYQSDREDLLNETRGYISGFNPKLLLQNIVYSKRDVEYTYYKPVIENGFWSSMLGDGMVQWSRTEPTIIKNSRKYSKDVPYTFKHSAYKQDNPSLFNLASRRNYIEIDGTTVTLDDFSNDFTLYEEKWNIEKIITISYRDMCNDNIIYIRNGVMYGDLNSDNVSYYTIYNSYLDILKGSTYNYVKDVSELSLLKQELLKSKRKLKLLNLKNNVLLEEKL